MADVVLAKALAATTLRPRAAAAGISDRALFYHVKDKAAVVSSILHCPADRLTALLTASAGPVPLLLDRLRILLFKLILAD